MLQYFIELMMEKSSKFLLRSIFYESQKGKTFLLITTIDDLQKIIYV